MPINHDTAQAGINALSSAVSQMRRDNLAVETALNVLIDQDVIDLENPSVVPDGVVIDANGYVQGTRYTWEEVAHCATALYGAAAHVNTTAVSEGGPTLAKAMNRLVLL